MERHRALHVRPISPPYLPHISAYLVRYMYAHEDAPYLRISPPYLRISTHISPISSIAPHLSAYLPLISPISPHISPYLPRYAQEDAAVLVVRIKARYSEI